MRLTLNHNTSNGGMMLDQAVKDAVSSGIDDPSDAVIPAWTSLYRVAHKRRFDRNSGQFVENPREAAFASPWWSTHYDFNASLWATDYADLSNTARATFAIHPAWRSDCSNFASIILETDLSVWYGLGKVVDGIDPATGQPLAAHPSKDVLQIYIPGFAANHAKWSSNSRVREFEKNIVNSKGYQGNLPLGLRPDSV
jgi:hypothetical protein